MQISTVEDIVQRIKTVDAYRSVEVCMILSRCQIEGSMED